MADGCAGGNCNQASSSAVGNAYTQLATIIRQTGGLKLFKTNDTPATVVRPGTPSLTARRSGSAVGLSWSLADNGGASVKKYRIYRGTISGQETGLVAVSGSTNHYVDTNASNTGVTYFYRVTAVNSAGESVGNNETAAAYRGDTCNGLTVAKDAAGDETGAPLNPDLDVLSLTVSEPTPDKLRLVMKVNGLTVLPNGSTAPNRKWVASWSYPTSTSDGGQYYVAMFSDASGVATFEYGIIKTQVVGLLVGVPQTNTLGAADPTSNFKADGTITFVVPKAAVGNPNAGDLMGNVLARTYADSTNNLRSTLTVDSNANGQNNDDAANVAMYTLAGSACTTSTTTTPGGGKKTTTTSSPSTDFAALSGGVTVVSF